MSECGRVELWAGLGYFVFIIRALSPTGALCGAIWFSDFPDLCYSYSWFPKKVASAAGSEAGMDCGTALAKQARLNPCGEALRGRFARPRVPALAAEGRFGETAARNVTLKVIPTTAGANSTASSRGAMRSIACRRMVQLAASLAPPGASFETPRVARLLRTRAAWELPSQFGFARKPLKWPDSRKKEAWNSLPLALNFLPNDLDFPSPGFGNPSTHLALGGLPRASRGRAKQSVDDAHVGDGVLDREFGRRLA